MPLFGIAAIEQPTKKEREDGKSERLVFGPEWGIGDDGQQVAFKLLLAAQQSGKLPPDLDMTRDKVDVSPFV